MMAQYPDVFIMTFSIHIPNFVLLSQTAQLLLIFCYAAPLAVDTGADIFVCAQFVGCVGSVGRLSSSPSLLG